MPAHDSNQFSNESYLNECMKGGRTMDLMWWSAVRTPIKEYIMTGCGCMLLVADGSKGAC